MIKKLLKRFISIFFICIIFGCNAFAETTAVDENKCNTTVENNISEEIEDKKPVYRLPEEVFVFPKEDIFHKEYIFITAIDPKLGDEGVSSSYPGYRGANQLIVYTPDFALRTGTNEFGAEVVVVGNTVMKQSGADSIIPRNGFVISGHGSAKTWINKNIRIGSKIYIDLENMTLISITTPSTYVFEVEEKLKEVLQVIKYYDMMNSCYDARKSLNYIAKANDLLKKSEKKYEKVQVYSYQAKKYTDFALQNALPYVDTELKGIWLRPTQHSPKEIEKVVQMLKEKGINNIFLETFYHGTTIYPSDVLKQYGVDYQRGEFIGFDPLQVWIEECHKRNIKVHIWFETFYIGNTPPRSSAHHILSVYPEWANKTKAMADSSEISVSASEHNGYFLDPANPEVQKFIGEILKEIAEKYNPDGINLDYIRYPQGANVKTDNSMGTEWGYTRFAREEFKADNNDTDPLTISVNDPLRQEWFKYRQNKITDFVRSTNELTKKHDIMLTAVIFPSIESAKATKMQDWRVWSEENLIDGITPLILTIDKRTLNSVLYDLKSQLSKNTKVYPGLFVTFMNGHISDLLLQVHEARKMRSDGVILFDYAHFHDYYSDALDVRAFNPKGQ